MSRNSVDRPHVLILGPPTEDPVDRERRIIHPATCPWDAYPERSWPNWVVGDPLHAGRRFHYARACLTAYEVENVGLDGLDVYPYLTEEQRQLPAARSIDAWALLPEGRYLITGYSEYVPGDFGGSYGAEWETGLRFIEEAA